MARKKKLNGAGDIREELAGTVSDLANANTDTASAANSIKHCELQCKMWRLMCSLYAMEGDATKLRQASQEGERWEKRRQEALKLQAADDWKEILRRLDEDQAAAQSLTELDD